MKTENIKINLTENMNKYYNNTKITLKNRQTEVIVGWPSQQLNWQENERITVRVCQVKSLLLYSAFNNQNCVKAALHQLDIELCVVCVCGVCAVCCVLCGVCVCCVHVCVCVCVCKCEY